MIKQRQESARAYEEGGRLDLAAQEQAEIGIIRDYLPRQMSETEVRAGDRRGDRGHRRLLDPRHGQGHGRI